MTLNIEKTHIVGHNFCLPLNGLKSWRAQSNHDLLTGDNNSLSSVTFTYEDREIVVPNCSLTSEMGRQILRAIDQSSSEIDKNRILKNCAIGSFVGSGCALGAFVLFTIWYHRFN
jgi:hypothetical protein